MDNSKIWNKNFTLLSISNLFVFLSFYFLIPTFPVYLSEFYNLDKTTIGLILSSYTVSAIIVRPFTGIFLDNYQRKMILTISLILYTFIFILYSFNLSTTVMFFIRFLHGISWGITTTAATTIAIDNIPSQKRGEGIGIYGISMTLAMAIGPMIGIIISDAFDYSFMFYSSTLICIISVILILFIDKSKVFQKKSYSSFLEYKNIFDKKSLPVSLNFMLIAIPYGVISAFISLYTKEINIGDTGLFFIIYSTGVAISRIFGGKVFDKNGPDKLIIASTFLIITGFILLALCNNIFIYVLSSFILGLGFGISFPTYQTMVNYIINIEKRGTANSTFLATLDFGIGIGMIMAGIVSDFFSISTSFIFSSIIVFLSYIIYLFNIKKYYHSNLLLK